LILILDKNIYIAGRYYLMLKPITRYGHLLFVVTIINFHAFSQTTDSTTNWDNQIYIGNKVAGTAGNWRFSGEFQVRLKDNMSALDNWFVEGIATYLVSEQFEIVPDLRYSIKPDEHELRTGLGIIYKFNKSNFQFVNQLKWQLDFDFNNNQDHGLRYAIFINRKLSYKLISSFAFGAFYRWRDNFNGFQFIRFGPGLSYVMNRQHTINFSYFLSSENNTEFWEWAGIPTIQLVININKDYKYLPAKYFSY
jgi:hypothetical protein